MENEQTPPLTEKKKVKVSNLQVADPGVHLFLETDDGSPYNSPLKIRIIITNTTNSDQFQSTVHITNMVGASQLQLMVPFGDPNFVSSSDTSYSITIDVRFTAPLGGGQAYDADPVNTTDAYYAGEFFDVSLITPLPPPTIPENNDNK